jgi:hypothetical protein
MIEPVLKGDAIRAAASHQRQGALAQRQGKFIASSTSAVTVMMADRYMTLRVDVRMSSSSTYRGGSVYSD